MLGTSCQQKNEDSQHLPYALRPELNEQFDSVFWKVNGTSCSDMHSMMVVQDGKVIYEKYGIGHNVAPWVMDDVMERTMPKQWNIGT